ncbi:MAG: Uma2 family endonuclease [Acidobacteriota bacterium]|nr:Uma2 family endonuclease [Acidobacteriota bacterium]
MAIATLLTIDDYELLPSELAEGHELVDGELVDVSGNNPEHNGLRDYLLQLLRPIVLDRKLGWLFAEQEYDFDGTAHGPDISFFGNGKIPLLLRKKRVQRFVPDFAIEIASPSDTHEGLLRKMNRYRRCGTQEVWLASPEAEEVDVYSDRRNLILRGRDLLETELIPGFSIAVGDLFKRGLPQ